MSFCSREATSEGLDGGEIFPNSLWSLSIFRDVWKKGYDSDDISVLSYIKFAKRVFFLLK